MVGIIAPAQSASAATFVPITGSGSTWSFSAIHVWANNLAQEGLPINYQPNGSSNGRTFFADGQITRWNDPKIAADNPGLTLPALQITPVVRSDSDGSTAVLTQWMLATQPAAWQAYCATVGRSPCTQTSTFPIQGERT